MIVLTRCTIIHHDVCFGPPALGVRGRTAAPILRPCVLRVLTVRQAHTFIQIDISNWALRFPVTSCRLQSAAIPATTGLGIDPTPRPCNDGHCSDSDQSDRSAVELDAACDHVLMNAFALTERPRRTPRCCALSDVVFSCSGFLGRVTAPPSLRRRVKLSWDDCIGDLLWCEPCARRSPRSVGSGCEIIAPPPSPHRETAW
jgi:hypothetical protein